MRERNAVASFSSALSLFVSPLHVPRGTFRSSPNDRGLKLAAKVSSPRPARSSPATPLSLSFFLPFVSFPSYEI